MSQASSFRRRGFSLVEIAAAGAVMAALIAIAIISFNNINQGKLDTQAEVNLNRVYTAEWSYYTAGNYRYTDLSGDAENPVPSRFPEELSHTSVASTGPNEISVATSVDAQVLGLAVAPRDDTCWLLRADAAGDTVLERAAAETPCSGASALDLG